MNADDSELLTGVFVVQLGFGTAQQVMAAAAEWATRRSEKIALSDILAQRGLLTPENRKMVEELSSRALQVNGGDVGRTLQSLSQGLNVLVKSLAHSMVSLPGDTALSKSQFDSLEGSENVSDEPIGRYDFETGPHGTTEELGRGGIGRVVVANDKFLGRDVAMKELLQEHTSNPNLATTRVIALEQRFLREARLTGQLEHPAIVPVFELGRRLNGGLYYTMQRVRGRTLAELLAEGRNLEGRLKQMGPYLTMCQAMAYAHSRSVVHRDLKPQNVMVGPFGETFVLDWGLARVKGKKDPRAQELKLQPDITGNVLEGGAIGTPSYMSPEQAEGKVDLIDERSDVWCLGAVLYEVLTGRPPYTGTNPFDVLGKIIKEKVRPVRELEPEAPPELCAIAEKALQHKKEDRYASAAELANDVQAWLGGGRVAAHDYNSFELIKRFVTRNKVALTVATIAFGVLLVQGGIGYRQVLAERDQAREFAQFFLEDVSDKLAPIAGSTPIVEELTHKTLDYYRKHVDPSSGPRDERLRLGRAWQKIGRLAVNVDKYVDAQSAFSFSEGIARPLVAEAPEDNAAQVLLAEALVGVGDCVTDMGQVEKADALFVEAEMHAQDAANRAPQDVEVLDTLARSYSRLGASRMTTGRIAEAVAPTRKSLEVDRRLAELQPSSDEAQTNVGISTQILADLMAHLGQLGEARKLNTEAIGYVERVIARQPDNIRALRAIVDFNVNRAQLAQMANDTETWRSAMLLAHKNGIALLQKEPDDSTARQFVAIADIELGHAEDAYRRLASLGDAAFGSELVGILAGAMFFTDRREELVSTCAKAAATARRTVCTYAALAAALKNDTETSARMASEASKDEHTDLRWVMDQATARFASPDTDVKRFALALSQKLDTAQRTLDEKAVTDALNEYVKNVAPKAP